MMGEARLWKTLWKLEPQRALLFKAPSEMDVYGRLLSGRKILKISYLFLFIAG
jgi:hypothetical protein